MKTLRTPEQVRQGIGKELNSANNRVAVIVTIPISKRKQDLGVQFWTQNDLTRGFVTNSDNTISHFIELY